jgi:hypothetical protein
MTKGEKLLVEFFKGMTGSFYTSFFELAFRADPDNQERLAAGFPSEMRALQRYKTENGYWQKLLEQYDNKKLTS